MLRWPRRRRQPENVTDAEVATSMRELAETFISGLAEDGENFTWESTEVGRLDDLCDAFLQNNPPGPVRHSMIMAMGCLPR
jgi:hypothetical protein